MVPLLGIESGLREAGRELLLKGVCASWGCSNQQPQLGGFTGWNLIFHSSGGRKSKIKLSEGPCSPRGTSGTILPYTPSFRWSPAVRGWQADVRWWTPCRPRKEPGIPTAKSINQHVLSRGMAQMCLKLLTG